MSSVRLVFAIATALPLTACVIDPPSRTSSELSNPTTLTGFVGAPGDAITLQAVDQNNGQLVPLGTATSATSATPYTAPTGTSYKLYEWSFDTGVLAANLWSPQTIIPDLATGQGHLEIVASAGGQNLNTFSQAAREFLACVRQRPGFVHPAIFRRDVNRIVRSGWSRQRSGKRLDDRAGHDLELPFALLFSCRLERRLLHGRRRQEDLWAHLLADVGRPVSGRHL